VPGHTPVKTTNASPAVQGDLPRLASGNHEILQTLVEQLAFLIRESGPSRESDSVIEELQTFLAVPITESEISWGQC
jgi:hypothetical protein